MTNPALQARLAGFLYLFVVIASVCALVATSSLIVADDAAATAANIGASELTFRLAFVANLLAGVAYVAVVGLLYGLMKPVNRSLSLVAAFLGLAGCAVSGASMINTLATLAYLGDATYFGAFETDQLQALARTALRLGALGNSVGLVFFGFYCLCLGALALGARFLPKVLGVLLTLAGLGWVIGSVTTFLAPALPLARHLLPASGLGELAFTLWLLVMGVNAQRWREQAATAS